MRIGIWSVINVCYLYCIKAIDAVCVYALCVEYKSNAMSKRKAFTVEEKAHIIWRLESGESNNEIAKELNVSNVYPVY